MLEFGFKCDKGKVREENQDAFFVMPDEGLFLVADGVGGHNYGELASRMTMKYMAEFIKEKPVGKNTAEDELKDYFLNIIINVNKYIHEIARKKAPGGMATTLIMLYVRDSKAYVINIGDSRGYLLRDEKIMRITVDHTYVNDLVRKGIITEQEARNHPDRNMITRAIGADTKIKPDFYMFDIYKDDVILLCTDGLYNEVSENDMCRIITENESMRKACGVLVDDANKNGGGDNITVVGVRI